MSLQRVLLNQFLFVCFWAAHILVNNFVASIFFVWIYEQPPLEEGLNHHPLKNVTALVSIFKNLAWRKLTELYHEIILKRQKMTQHVIATI
jgi:hypothetical protein